MTSLQRVAVACGAVWLGFAADEASAAIPARERAALIALYNSTNGAGWANRFNWRNATDTDFAPPGTECTWAGVYCDTSDRPRHPAGSLLQPADRRPAA